MPAQALYRKWRPQLWDEVVGQAHVVQTLRNALRSERITHAYLFAGPRGCGKTTTARLIAKALNCLNADPAQRPCNTCAHCLAVNDGRFLDLIEIDGASNNSVENVRDLRDKINFAPGQGRFKVYIIDEVHMLSLGAFNALLKTLEEPPAHAVFILATTEVYKVPATVSSRCQRFEFRRIPVNEIIARLTTLCEQEDLSVDEAALEIIARQATGSLRDAISLLDQLVAGDSTVTLARAEELLGTAASQTVQELAGGLAAGDVAAGLGLINAAIDAGADPRQLARQIVDYLRALLLARLGSAALVEAAPDARAALAGQAESWTVAALLRAIRAFGAAANDVRGGWQPQLPLELAVAECGLAEVVAEQPAAVAAPAAAAPAPRRARKSAPSGEPADLRTTWDRMIKELLEQKRILRLTARSLENCGVERLDDGVLHVATHDKVFLRKIAAPDKVKVLNLALSELLGANCTVAFHLNEAAPGRPAPNVPTDSMVATALRDLGGEIIE